MVYDCHFFAVAFYDCLQETFLHGDKSEFLISSKFKANLFQTRKIQFGILSVQCARTTTTMFLWQIFPKRILSEHSEISSYPWWHTIACRPFALQKIPQKAKDFVTLLLLSSLLLMSISKTDRIAWTSSFIHVSIVNIYYLLFGWCRPFV